MQHKNKTGMKSLEAQNLSCPHRRKSLLPSNPLSNRTARATWLFLFIAVAAHATRAKADGMAMPPVTATDGNVRATDQRALLWLRNGAWEIHINPIFIREQAAAAWVVPFPALPHVSESNAVLFEELELTTSPIFIHYCTPQSSGSGDGGMGADAAFGGGGENTDVETSVKIWDQGEVGELEYVVLSTDQGDDLVVWLMENGYVLPDHATDLIAEFETEGQYFFVARIGEHVDPHKPISPVRFVLPEMEDPLYPLRLTGMGVEGNEKLSLTLWLAFTLVRQSYPYEHNIGFIPAKHFIARLSDVPTEAPTDGDSYDRIVDDYFETHPSDQLLLQYGKSMVWSLPAKGHRCLDGIYYMCAFPNDLGISYNRQWSPEINEMIEEQNWLFRFEGSLDSTALEKDLVFKGVEWHSNNIKYFNEENVFGVNTGPCSSSNDPYNPKRDAETHWDAHYRDASSPPFPFPLASSGDSCGCSITNKTNNLVFQILLLLMAAALFLHRFKRRRSSTPKS